LNGIGAVGLKSALARPPARVAGGELGEHKAKVAL
jgi:hypothetical protein